MYSNPHCAQKSHRQDVGDVKYFWWFARTLNPQLVCINHCMDGNINFMRFSVRCASVYCAMQWQIAMILVLETIASQCGFPNNHTACIVLPFHICRFCGNTQNNSRLWWSCVLSYQQLATTKQWNQSQPGKLCTCVDLFVVLLCKVHVFLWSSDADDESVIYYVVSAFCNV